MKGIALACLFVAAAVQAAPVKVAHYLGPKDPVQEYWDREVSGGSFRFYGNIEFSAKDMDALSETIQKMLAAAGAKLTSANIAFIIKRVLPQAVDLLPRLLDREYLAKRAMMDRAAAVAAMHRPEDREQWGQARRRLAYDECLLMQLGIALLRQREEVRPAYPLPCNPQIDRGSARGFRSP